MRSILIASIGANLVLLLVVFIMCDRGMRYVQESERTLAVIQLASDQLPMQVRSIINYVVGQRDARKANLAECTRLQGNALRCRKWIGL